jgi:ribosome recycling factor
MTPEETAFEAEEKMEKTVEFLKAEYRAVRTGRASTALVEHIKIDYYGTQTPLNQLANISTPEATMIVVKPFDISAAKEIEKAILASSLGITPNNDGKLLRLAIPPLSGERRQQLAQTVKQMGEHARVSVRNARRDANKHLDQAQKDKEISEDNRDDGKLDMDDLTKKYVAKVDEMVKTKTEEIMEV